jgi:MFS family permease
MGSTHEPVMVEPPAEPSATRAHEQASRATRWRVLAALFVVAIFSYGLAFYGLGFYLRELRLEHGWSLRAVTAFTLSFQLCATMLGFWVGVRVERHGPRGVFVLGALALGSSVFVIGQSMNLASVGAAYLLLAVGWACLNVTPISATVFAWYPERASGPLSLTLTGGSVGGLLIVPALTMLSARLGFATALTIVGGVTVALLLPLAAFVIKRPAVRNHASIDQQSRPSGRVIVLRQARFWVLLATVFLGLTAQGGFLVHQFNLIASSLNASAAASIVAGTAVASVVGRLSFGALTTRRDFRPAAASFLALQTLGFALLAVAAPSQSTLTIASAAVGLGVGVLVTTPALMTRAAFPHITFGVAFPMVAMAQQLGIAAGPVVTTLVHDRFGGYAGALAVLSGVAGVAFALTIAEVALGMGSASGPADGERR